MSFLVDHAVGAQFRKLVVAETKVVAKHRFGVFTDSWRVCLRTAGHIRQFDWVTRHQHGLVDAVGHPEFALHLDVKAMCSEQTPMADLIRKYAPTAGHFHANDANLRGPGFGEIDFVPIFRQLRDAGYDRWVSVEVFDYKPDPETIARDSIDYMRRSLPA